MEPTNAEVIFYVVIAVISLVILLACTSIKDDTIEITWTKKRDIAREEKKVGTNKKNTWQIDLPVL